MKSVIFIIFLLPLTLYCQGDYGVLKVEVSFKKLAGLNQRIRGKIKINNNSHPIINGNVVVAKIPGDYLIKSECWMNALSMTHFYTKNDKVNVKANDTTYLKIEIPDSLIKTVNYLPLLDITGKFFPLVDSLAFLDEEGKKYGIFTSPRSYIGDCLNYFGTSYVLYDGDEILLQVEEICDMNFCYENQHPYSITFTRYSGNKKVQLILHPEYNICQSINDDIYFRMGQKIESNGPILMDFITFFRKNIRKSLVQPFEYLNQKMVGDYLLFTDDILCDTLVIK